MKDERKQLKPRVKNQEPRTREQDSRTKSRDESAEKIIKIKGKVILEKIDERGKNCSWLCKIMKPQRGRYMPVQGEALEICSRLWLVFRRSLPMGIPMGRLRSRRWPGCERDDRFFAYSLFSYFRIAVFPGARVRL